MNLLPLPVMVVLAMSGADAGAVTFRKHVIDPAFRAEACAAADINRDGRLDIIAGPNWYEGPQWRPHKFREIAIMGIYADVRCDNPVDLNNDGWLDIAMVRRNGTMEWLENPKGADGEWKAYKIGNTAESEPVWFADLDGDGRGEFIAPFGEKAAGIAVWRAEKDPTAPWKVEDIGPNGGDKHGIGVGDVDRDGKTDIVTRAGWYDHSSDGPWKWHDLDRGDTHQPMVYDFDGDGDADIAAGAPHDYGLYWWEQSTDDKGNATWTRHEIDRSISQMHAIALADIDGDGDSDLVSGKRYKAHEKGDPGTDDPVLLVWYELSRSGGKVVFKRHDIDSDSGVGCIVTPVDIDGDGDIDMLTATKKGVFLFEREGKPTLLPIFNGRDLDNWVGDKTLWSAQDGAIVGKTEKGIKHNNFLVSREKYDDFVLTLDVKLEPDGANSGIQFRSKPRDDGECEGYQADVGVGWWGSIYEEMGRGLLNDGYKGRGEKAAIKNGWNHYVVYAVGPELRMNGTLCTTIRDEQRKTGIIAFQIHSGGPTDIRLKNIQLRKVEKSDGGGR